MAYKAHPFYDQSNAEDWLSLDANLPQNAQGRVSEALLRVVRDEKEQLCALALARIKAQAGPEFLAERPHSLLGDYLFYPTSASSYQVYIEYFFQEKPPEFYIQRGQSDHYSDHWWAIINCPFALDQHPPTLKHYVIGIGWIVL